MTTSSVITITLTKLFSLFLKIIIPFLWENLVQPYLFLYTPGSLEVGGQKNFFAHSAREIVPPTFKIMAPPLIAYVRN